VIRVIFNQKGGVGKSSITSNLAAISAEYGFRTLAVDLDQQCNTSQYLLGEEFADVPRTIADFFASTVSFARTGAEAGSYVVQTAWENLDMICASPELGELQHKLESKHKILKLRDLLNDLALSYEAIYIDTPPAFNFYTLSALIAAQSCLIPFDCDEFSRQALYSLIDNVEETRADHNPGLKIEGIIVNQFQAAANFPMRIVDELCDEGLPVFESLLSHSIKMRESHHASVPLVYFAPSHKLTQEYLALFEEFNADQLIFEDEEELKAG